MKLIASLFMLLFLTSFETSQSLDTRDSIPPKIAQSKEILKSSIEIENPKVRSRPNTNKTKTKQTALKEINKEEVSPIKSTVSENLIFREILAHNNLEKEVENLHKAILRIENQIRNNQKKANQEHKLYIKTTDSLTQQLEDLQGLLTSFNKEFHQHQFTTNKTEEVSNISFIPTYEKNKDKPLPPLVYLIISAVICLFTLGYLFTQLKKGNYSSSLTLE